MHYQKILIQVEHNSSAEKVVKYGCDLAAQLGASVLLMSVLDPEGMPDMFLSQDSLEESLYLKEKAAMNTFLETLTTTYGGTVSSEFLIGEGPIKDTVLKIAVEHQVQLIVCGTHGRKGLNRFLHGSIAEEVLRDSQVPLFIVPIH